MPADVRPDQGVSASTRPESVLCLKTSTGSQQGGLAGLKTTQTCPCLDRNLNPDPYPKLPHTLILPLTLIVTSSLSLAIMRALARRRIQLCYGASAR